MGGLCALIVKRALKRRARVETHETLAQRPLLLACGLVSGAALMNILLAIPFSLSQNLDILRVLPKDVPLFIPNVLGFLSLIGLGVWFYTTGKAK